MHFIVQGYSRPTLMSCGPLTACTFGKFAQNKLTLIQIPVAMSSSLDMNTDEIRRQTALHIARYWIQFAQNQLALVEQAVKQAEVHFRQIKVPANAKLPGKANNSPERDVGSRPKQSEPRRSSRTIDVSNNKGESVQPTTAYMAPDRRRVVSFSAMESLHASAVSDLPRTPYPFPVSGEGSSFTAEQVLRTIPPSPVSLPSIPELEPSQGAEPLLDPAQLGEKYAVRSSGVGPPAPCIEGSTESPKSKKMSPKGLSTTGNEWHYSSSLSTQDRSSLPLSLTDIQLTSPYLSDLDRHRMFARLLREDSNRSGNNMDRLIYPFPFQNGQAPQHSQLASMYPSDLERFVALSHIIREESSRLDAAIHGIIRGQATEEDGCLEAGPPAPKRKDLGSMLGGMPPVKGSPTRADASASPTISLRSGNLYPGAGTSDLDGYTATNLLATGDFNKLDAAIEGLIEGQDGEKDAQDHVVTMIRQKNLEGRLGGLQNTSRSA